ncbi:MAG TPA: hypothetical protein VM577_19535 [Anaerovoracaceae bacterium]|nr:hypothetical protein [Anaerovoracaceae bacterium]
MKESILIAGEVYLMGFTISILIAAMIKGMLVVIRRISSKKDVEIQQTTQE